MLIINPVFCNQTIPVFGDVQGLLAWIFSNVPAASRNFVIVRNSFVTMPSSFGEGSRPRLPFGAPHSARGGAVPISNGKLQYEFRVPMISTQQFNISG
jgi:hypothetical protein